MFRCVSIKSTGTTYCKADSKFQKKRAARLTNISYSTMSGTLYISTGRVLTVCRTMRRQIPFLRARRNITTEKSCVKTLHVPCYHPLPSSRSRGANKEILDLISTGGSLYPSQLLKEPIRGYPPFQLIFLNCVDSSTFSTQFRLPFLFDTPLAFKSCNDLQGESQN